MNSKQLNRISFDVQTGAPQQQLQAACEAKPQLKQDMNRLTEDARHQRAENKSWCEAWLSRQLVGEARPLALPQDVRDARLATVMGILLTFVHLGLDFAMAVVMLINPLFLIGVSLVLIFGVKSVLLLLLDDRLRPQRTKQRLQRFVLWPSLVLLLLSAGVLASGRTALGALALWLAGALNLALCGLGIASMGLATGLFCMAYLYNRSKYAERRYRVTECEAVETLRVLQLVERIERELQPPAVQALPTQPTTMTQPVVMPQRRPASPSTQPSTQPLVWMPLNDPRVQRAQQSSRNGFHGNALPFVLPLLLAGALSLSGCTPKPAAEPVAQAQAPTVEAAAAGRLAIAVYVDWSKSESDEALAQGAQALVQAASNLAVMLRAGELTVNQFGDDGWEAPQVVAIALPAWQAAAGSEADLFYGQIGAAKQAAALADYRQRVAAQLKPLTAATLLPGATAREPRCTDVQGVLRRIAETNAETRGLAILLSDLHESCAEALTPVAVGPQAPMLVVMLLPERQPEGKADATATHELYAQRRAEIARIYPGAVVVPHFGNVTQAVQKAWRGAASSQVAASQVVTSQVVTSQ